MQNPVIAYFGQNTVEAAIKAYFKAYFDKHGLTPTARDELITIAKFKEDAFFEMVSDFVCNKG